MQDAFVGDVGDFGKYALLNALAGADVPLGVMWFNNPVAVANGDGGFTNYQRLQHCDRELYGKLQKIVNGNRCILEIERSDILPSNTRFYSEFVPVPRNPCSSPQLAARQSAEREDWFKRGFEKLAEASLVFFDPDNGLPPSGMGKHVKSSGLYTFLDETAACLASGKSVVLYQHLRRGSSVDSQIAEQMPILQCGTFGCWAVSFHRWSVRFFYILSASPEHDMLLRRRTNQFINGPWGKRGSFEREHFLAHGLSSEQ